MKASIKTGGDVVEETKEDLRSESCRGFFDEAKNRRGNNSNVVVRDKF